MIKLTSQVKISTLITASSKLLITYCLFSFLLTAILHTVFLPIHLNISYITPIVFVSYLSFFYILDKFRPLKWIDLLIANIFWLLLLAFAAFVNWKVCYTYMMPIISVVFLSFLTIYLSKNRKLVLKVVFFVIGATIVSIYSMVIVPKWEYNKRQMVVSNIDWHVIFEDSWVLKDANGNNVSMASLKNKVVYVEFWFSTCPPCLAKLPTIKLLKQKFIGQDKVVFVSIITGNADSFEVFKSWAGRYQDTFDWFLYAPKKSMEVFIKKTGISRSPYEAIFLNGTLQSAHFGFTIAEAPYYLKEKEELISKLLKEMK